VPGRRDGTGSGAGRGSGDQPDSDLDLSTVYDPPQRLGGPGDDLQLTDAPDDGAPESTAGRVQGEGLRNQALIPYLDVLADYAAQASRTVEQPGYPVRLRTTVRDYFDRLAVPAGAGAQP
jgi:hypothetical protein